MMMHWEEIWTDEQWQGTALGRFDNGERGIEADILGYNEPCYGKRTACEALQTMIPFIVLKCSPATSAIVEKMPITGKSAPLPLALE